VIGHVVGLDLAGDADMPRNVAAGGRIGEGRVREPSSPGRGGGAAAA